MANQDKDRIYKDMMFGFILFQEPFNWDNKPPKPPPGYIKYNPNKANCQSGKCPNCGAEKPEAAYGSSGNGFQNKRVNQLCKALKRLSGRIRIDDKHWKPFYELFSTDLIPERGKYQTMLKCHPSRYSSGEFHCCKAKIWHDFFDVCYPETISLR